MVEQRNAIWTELLLCFRHLATHLAVNRYSRNLVFLNRKLLFDASVLAGVPGLVFKPGGKSLLCSLRMHLFGSVSWNFCFRSLDGLPCWELLERRMPFARCLKSLVQWLQPLVWWLTVGSPYKPLHGWARGQLPNTLVSNPNKPKVRKAIYETTGVLPKPTRHFMLTNYY